MKMYWTQHKVFFVATLALFPSYLKGQMVDPVFYKPYFNGFDYLGVELLLCEYRNLGYLQFEKERHGNFIITEIDSNKASDDLYVYLDQWQAGELVILSGKKPSDIRHQNELLLGALVNASKKYQEHPRVTLYDIYGTVDYSPPFWELVLSYQLIHGKGKIIQLGYDRKLSGLYEDDAQPYVELEITDSNERRTIELSAKSSEPISDEDPEELEYKGLLATRDGLFSYNGKKINFTTQQCDVMRVFMRRPEELRTEEDFTDPLTSIFNGNDYPDIHQTLSQLISATHVKLRKETGKKSIFNEPKRGWRLEI